MDERTRIGVIVVVMVLQVISCSVWDRETSVRVSVPPMPRYWTRFPGRFEYQVWWIDSSGTTRKRTVPGETRTVELKLPKMRGIPVLVFPTLFRDPVIDPIDGAESAGDRESYRLLPAGALFPDHLGGTGTLRPDWSGGAASLVLWRIAVSTGRPRRYHGARLYSELYARTGGDPWSADLDSIGEQLVSGSFRSTSIRPRPRHAVSVVASPGKWLREAPAAPPVESVSHADDGILELELEAAVHRFYHSITGEVLTIAVDDRGRTSVRR